MLLIGDIHITTRMTDRILTMLRDFVDAHPDEDDIVFVGDYVYHFAYDRVALFALYELFVELFEKWKRVYILAGNHDRIGSSFVYAEAKKAFDLLHSQSKGKLHFITKPEIHNIDGKEVLFFPYMIEKAGPIPSYNIDNASTAQQAVHTQVTSLQDSDNKHEQFSAYINAILLHYVLKHPDITIVHHYYTNAIQFPGYRSRFGFKDIAISEHFLDMTSIRLISGHVHAPFCHKNYLCVGSIWSTSSLEHNTIKWLVQYNHDKVDISIQLLNPYRVFEQEWKENPEHITPDHIQKLYDNILQAYRGSYLASDVFTINIEQRPLPSLVHMHVQILVDELNYDKLDTYVDQNILAQCKDIKLKKHNKAVQDLMEQFSASNQKVVTTFSDRKQVLKDYVKSKYPDDYAKYEEVLQELKVI